MKSSSGKMIFEHLLVNWFILYKQYVRFLGHFLSGMNNEMVAVANDRSITVSNVELNQKVTLKLLKLLNLK